MRGQRMAGFVGAAGEEGHAMGGRRPAVLLAAAGAALVAGAAVAWRRRGARASGATFRRGRFPNGMDYAVAGRGERVLLFIQGGPGSEAPAGSMVARLHPWIAPLVGAGFTVWVVTRRRGMPAGHSVADMADDYARLIREELGGRVDVVLGESFGGLVVQYLAARHPTCCDRVVIQSAACEVSVWGKDVDRRLLAALEAGEWAEAGAVFAEYLLPGERMRWVRRMLGPMTGRMLTGRAYPVSDVVVETQAELDFNSRAILPDVAVPVLMVCGDRDLFFPADLVAETAALIPDCTVVWRPGRGHVKTTTDQRSAADILAFLNREQAGETGRE